MLPHPRLKIILLIILYVIAAYRITFLFISEPGLPTQQRTIIGTTLENKAHRPFAYRVLVPYTIKLISSQVSKETREQVLDWFKRLGWNEVYVKKFRWEKDFIFENLIATFLIFSLFLGFLFIARELIYSFYDYPSYIGDLAPLGHVILLPLFFTITNYLYDPAVLFFSATALLMINNRRHFLFFLIFILASFNKETSILLIAIFWLKEYQKMPFWPLCGWLIALGTVAITVKTLLFYIFYDNMGAFVSFHWKRNLEVIALRSERLPYFHIFFILYTFLVSYGWFSKPAFLRNVILFLFPVLFVSGMISGWIDEIRIFLDMYPTLFLLTLPTLIALFEVPIKNVEDLKARI